MPLKDDDYEIVQEAPNKWRLDLIRPDGSKKVYFYEGKEDIPESDAIWALTKWREDHLELFAAGKVK